MMPARKSLEKALRGVRVSELLQQNIDDFAVLVDGSPQASLRVSNPDEDRVNEERVAVAAVPELVQKILEFEHALVLALDVARHNVGEVEETAEDAEGTVH
jgi:hypothetical protein